MSRRGHRYPDVYFDVILNAHRTGTVVEYRLWRRPGGRATGHADLRINVKHATIDATNPGGGDVIMFERTGASTGPAYEVWIVAPNDPAYRNVRARCIHAVAARGAAGAKNFGFF